MCSDGEFGAMPGWDVSLVTTMRDAFKDRSTFNANISGWNTASVTEMVYMFAQVGRCRLTISNPS